VSGAFLLTTGQDFAAVELTEFAHGREVKAKLPSHDDGFD